MRGSPLIPAVIRLGAVGVVDETPVADGVWGGAQVASSRESATIGSCRLGMFGPLIKSSLALTRDSSRSSDNPPTFLRLGMVLLFVDVPVVHGGDALDVGALRPESSDELARAKLV